MKEILSIDGCTLTIEDVVSVARGDTYIDISETAKESVIKCREYIDSLLSTIDDKNKGDAIYGVTTGFGDLVSQQISPDELEHLQENLIRSHCAGTGEVFPDNVILGAMILRINSLARGNSGISPEVLQLLSSFINKRIIPYVPSQGSLGASGDLCPLAHIALSLIGEGTVKVNDSDYRPTGEVMAQYALKPAKLKAKEGLALLNGSQFIASLACHNVIDGENLLRIADIALSMSLEALAGTISAFDERITDLRPFKGSFATSSNVRKITSGSSLLNPSRIQDAYSLRCAPQIHGTARDTYNFIRSMVEIEVNSVTDNPLIFPDDNTILSGGNFHGQPLAMALDLSAIVLTNIANVSERRIERLVNNKLSKHLPPFLTANPGLNSGLMICHYTAASLVSENRTLSHPASVDSIPVSAAQEDVVSMGTIAGRKAMTILENTFNVLSIELLAAAQALDFAGASKAGTGTRVAHDFIRSFIPTLEGDRVFQGDIAKISESLKSTEFVDTVEKRIGKLK